MSHWFQNPLPLSRKVLFFLIYLAGSYFHNLIIFMSIAIVCVTQTVCVLAMQGIGLGDWKERTVGFGSDGAAVIVGCRSGVATRLRQDIPWLVNIQCLAHGLELAAVDAIKANDAMKKVDTLLHGLYKQYQYSPKVLLYFIIQFSASFHF